MLFGWELMLHCTSGTVQLLRYRTHCKDSVVNSGVDSTGFVVFGFHHFFFLSCRVSVSRLFVFLKRSLCFSIKKRSKAWHIAEKKQVSKTHALPILISVSTTSDVLMMTFHRPTEVKLWFCFVCGCCWFCVCMMAYFFLRYSLRLFCSILIESHCLWFVVFFARARTPLLNVFILTKRCVIILHEVHNQAKWT